MIGGNLNNYNTFENLSSGVRLFDYTVNMRSINHRGILFDNLSFSNFGYGGDPNDVSRLRIEKNKWYDFRALFRRDKNFWNYNLLANPLNPANFNPAAADHQFAARTRFIPPDAGLRSDSLPQSRFRFRLGYSRNVNRWTRIHHARGRNRTSAVGERARHHEFLPDGSGLPRHFKNDAVLR